jgi:hypothetical protein
MRAAVGSYTVCQKCPVPKRKRLTSSQGACLSAPEGSHESVIVFISTFEPVKTNFDVKERSKDSVTAGQLKLSAKTNERCEK